MDISLFKRMGVHDGKMVNEHLYGMPPHWKSEAGKKADSDKSCIKHGTVKDKPNMQYFADGGSVQKSRPMLGGPGSILSKEAVEYHKNRKHYDQNGRQLDADGGFVKKFKPIENCGSGWADSIKKYGMPGKKADGGKVSRKKLAVGAVAKIRKDQY